VLVARDDSAPSSHTSSADVSEPIVSLVVDGPPGTVPDFSGLSAREAVRRIVKLGMNASIAGDGFVVSQDPPPGLPIEDDGVCHLVLERLPRHPVAAGRP
jgi:beta-lactam-binding protein with PASTA domain